MRCPQCSKFVSYDVEVEPEEQDAPAAEGGTFICNKHGLLTDPIALLDTKNNRMVFACPECVNDPKLQARWEAEK